MAILELAPRGLLSGKTIAHTFLFIRASAAVAAAEAQNMSLRAYLRSGRASDRAWACPRLTKGPVLF